MTGTISIGFPSAEIADVLLNGKFQYIITVAKTGRANFVCTNYASDDACIQAAIDYAASNSITELWIFDGIYTISKPITCTTDLNLRGIGKVTLISNQVSGSIPEIFNFSGSVAATTEGSADVSKGALSISVINAPNISIGDLLLIYDDTIWGDGTDYPTWKTGEIHEVKSISGNTISFSDGVLHAYTTVNNLMVRVITPIRIIIDNLKFAGASATTSNGLVYLTSAKDSSIQNCAFDMGGYAGIIILNCYNTTISKNNISHCEMAGLGYGISMNDATAHTHISQNNISFCRHCVASGGYGVVGQSREINITGNTLTAGSNHVIDAHPCVESIYAENNIIYGDVGSQYAMASGAKNSIFRGNIVYNGLGATTRGNTKDMLFFVESNKFYNSGYAFRDVNGTDACTLKYISIVDNHMFNSMYYVVYLTKTENANIVNNSIDQTTDYYGMYIKGLQNGIISNNHIQNIYRVGVYLDTCSNISITGNIIENCDGINSTGDLYDSGITLINCSSNHIYNNRVTDALGHQRYSIKEVGTSDNNIIESNYVSGALTKTILKIGASSTVKNNRGYSTENTGTATITASATTVNITHGLAATPTRVTLSPTADTAGKRYWVSTKGATTFTITVDSAHTSDIIFDWEAIV